jgi:anthranilate synthase/aminodeoxychorismate synthase-like glutamine amidotransferase
MEIIDSFYLNLPILGICLGMQAIGEYFGAKLVHAYQPVHGKTSLINHNETGLFDNVESPTKVMRYHSLLLVDLPKCLIPLAWTEQKELMAIQHLSLPVCGVQFHPESVLTCSGLIILNNWLKTCQKDGIVLK